MKFKQRIQSVIIFLIVSLILPEAEANKGQYHGLSQMSVRLRSRIFHSTDQFELKEYLGSDEGLVRLMGSHQKLEGTRHFVNGKPSGISYMLYHVVMRSLAEDLLPLCEDGSGELVIHKGTVNDVFQKSVLALCRGNARVSQLKPEQLRQVWNQVFAHQAPESEYQAWQKYVLRQWGEKKINAVFTDLMRTLLMHPIFLFQW